MLLLPLNMSVANAQSTHSVSYSSQTQTNAPQLPVKSLTPGDVSTSFGGTTDLNVICNHSTKERRNVTVEEKKQVYAEYAKYGVTYTGKAGQYEVDHLIPLELGGSNSIKNLWPQEGWMHPWNFHVKDKLENELHRRVCLSDNDPDYLTLKAAQDAISWDWIKAYQEFMSPDHP